MIIDIHTHTYPTSDDSMLTPEELIQEAKRIGLDGVAYRQHSNGNIRRIVRTGMNQVITAQIGQDFEKREALNGLGGGRKCEGRQVFWSEFAHLVHQEGRYILGDVDRNGKHYEIRNPDIFRAACAIEIEQGMALGLFPASFFESQIHLFQPTHNAHAHVI